MAYRYSTPTYWFSTPAFWFFFLLISCLFGLLTRKIAMDKGYNGTSFFWRGFIGWFLAVIVIVCKQNRNMAGSTRYVSQEPRQVSYLDRIEKGEMHSGYKQWKCEHCGQMNAAALDYCTSCRRDKNEKVEHKVACPSCGASNKQDNNTCWVCKKPLHGEQKIRTSEATEHDTPPSATTNVSIADEIIKFKQLADQGVITAEEFEAKKNALMSM